MIPSATTGVRTRPGGKTAAVLLIAILVLLSSGVELGDSFQPARILIVLALFWVQIRHGTMLSRSRCQNFLLLLGGIWILWGLISLTWTPDLANGARELTGIALGLVTAYTVMRLVAHAPGGFGAMRTGWVWAFVCTLPIAVWEILYDQHMPGSYGRAISGGGTEIAITYAAATFGNRNTYAAFLVLALPFLLWTLQDSRGWRRSLMVLVVTAAIGIQLLDASRLGAAATCLELLAWLLLTKNGKAKWGMALAGLLLVGVLDNIMAYLPYTQLRYDVLLHGRDQSVLSRAGLLQNGMQFIAETAGAGVGAGGFAASMTAGRGQSDALDAIDPHNVWIEVAAQYGILVIVAFVGWLIYCVFILLRASSRKPRAPEITEGAVYSLVLLAGLPLNGLMNSSYITFTFFWAALGCVAGIVSVTERARSRPCRKAVVWRVVDTISRKTKPGIPCKP